ncbi:MAG: hypothetical protein ACHQ1H_00290 [Nitrososphaerales archaeon]
MPETKSAIAILMGIIILIADIAWLIVGGSYTYAPWLVLGIVIFVATLVWLFLDFSLMREARTPPHKDDQTSPSKTKN